MQQDKSRCPHRNLQGPEFLGQTGAFCVDCGANLPCPHPPSARTTEQFLGGESVTTCDWCGEEF